MKEILIKMIKKNYKERPQMEIINEELIQIYN